MGGSIEEGSWGTYERDPIRVVLSKGPFRDAFSQANLGT